MNIQTIFFLPHYSFSNPPSLYQLEASMVEETHRNKEMGGDEEGTRSIFCCSSDFLQLVLTTARSEVKPTVCHLIFQEKNTL